MAAWEWTSLDIRQLGHICPIVPVSPPKGLESPGCLMLLCQGYQKTPYPKPLMNMNPWEVWYHKSLFKNAMAAFCGDWAQSLSYLFGGGCFSEWAPVTVAACVWTQAHTVVQLLPQLLPHVQAQPLPCYSSPNRGAGFLNFPWCINATKCQEWCQATLTDLVV